ncbi:MAG: hypothetical protein J0I32_12330 [Sphingobacteriales bacterium]|nr:hypothetical protein [Sphingobacteriales bacterium]OJW00945.1 MAG: hypothetical protein BGO52_05745 [Sphingobacteriales bacterium 44-61]
MIYQRNDMEGRFYNWVTDSSRAIFAGRPSRRLFDRFNGDQVLFIINFYASFFERFTLEEARELERQIANNLPMGAKSEISVFNWIKDTSKQVFL